MADLLPKEAPCQFRVMSQHVNAGSSFTARLPAWREWRVDKTIRKINGPIRLYIFFCHRIQCNSTSTKACYVNMVAEYPQRLITRVPVLVVSTH